MLKDTCLALYLKTNTKKMEISLKSNIKKNKKNKIIFMRINVGEYVIIFDLAKNNSACK